jgi:hypothetical protein
MGDDSAFEVNRQARKEKLSDLPDNQLTDNVFDQVRRKTSLFCHLLICCCALFCVHRCCSRLTRIWAAVCRRCGRPLCFAFSSNIARR